MLAVTLIEGDIIIQDDSEVANTLNDFFSNAVASLNINIPSECITEDVTDTGDVIILKYSNHPSIKLINNNVSKGNFSFNEVHVSEVKKLLEEIDGEKATMSSSIPPKVLKESIDICCEPLVYIINKGIVDTCFDGGLKIADLTPIYKADETTNKRNYRNISLLPAVSKIFENIMQGQISVYMEKYLSPFLCGYRKGFNAQYALLSMLEKWRTSLDNGGYGVGGGGGGGGSTRPLKGIWYHKP